MSNLKVMKNKDEREYLGEVMSNFDNIIDYDIAKALSEKENTYASYPAWDFHGTVWFEDDQYHCEVWRYHSHTDTISADTIVDLMSDVSNEYGWE